MFSMYGGSGKTIWEMTPEERKITLVVMGITILIVIVFGIYYFLKHKEDK